MVLGQERLPIHRPQVSVQRRKANTANRHVQFQRELCETPSPAERSLYDCLKKSPAFPGPIYWNEPFTVPGRTYYLDIYFPNLKLAIEVDGTQHLEPKKATT